MKRVIKDYEESAVNPSTPTASARWWDKEWIESDSEYVIHTKTKGVVHECAFTAIEDRQSETEKRVKRLPFNLPIIPVCEDEIKVVERDNIVAIYLPIVDESSEFYSYYQYKRVDYEVTEGELIADIIVELYKHSWFRDHNHGSNKTGTRVLVFRKGGEIKILERYQWRDDALSVNKILYENEEGEVESYYPPTRGGYTAIISYPPLSREIIEEYEE
ncbi:MAG: hypothetical protein OCU22_03750 [Canidatus Methanoxibalbensis ujae]|nr:hypothetical protein [Candidatus Methanoxibalbensis ujae]